MIFGIFHEGSGIGNQLHRYVMTRVLAKDMGCDWGMLNPELFKASSFLKIEMGLWTPNFYPPRNEKEREFFKQFNFYNEKKVTNKDYNMSLLYSLRTRKKRCGQDVRGYDWEGIKGIKDNSIIDGEFQGELYYEHRLKEINEWLKVEPIEMADDVCAIGFRGGGVHGPPSALPHTRLLGKCSKNNEGNKS